jgi:methanogenic corrinoid protein MtbC1
MDQLVAAIVDGNRSEAVETVRLLRNQGVTHGELVTDGVEAAMKQLDLKCTAERFSFLEIMLSGRAVMGVVNELYPAGTEMPNCRGTVVLCAVKGDIHDLGKNIVKIVFTASGYRVVDCGTDCPVDLLVSTAEKEGAIAVGLSSLITTTVPNVRKVRTALRARGLGRIPVLAGGAALMQASAEDLNVDFVARSVFDGLRFLEETTDNERS